MEEVVLNSLARYFTSGLARVFPDLAILPETLPRFEPTSPLNQFLLEDPLQQLSSSKELPCEAEVDQAFLQSQSALLSRLRYAVDLPLHGPSIERLDAFAKIRFSIELGEDSIFLSCRPFGTELEILGGYLIALSAVGVLDALEVGDIDLDEAVNLMFRPRTASLFGRIPFGTEVVAALHELLADLFCSPPGALERTHLESQILLFYNAVEGYVENVQSNYSIDPRWALTARVARTVSRLQLKEF